MKKHNEKFSLCILLLTVFFFNDGPNFIKYPLLISGIIFLIWAVQDYYKNEAIAKSEEKETKL